jgi:glyoxylate/hydroxypyruvate reductase A
MRSIPALVRYAAVWKPKPGALREFPKLEVIFNLGAGVDAVVADPTLPDVPLVRVAVDDLTQRMTEYVVMHVLMHHRRQGYYAESQRNRVWAPKLQWAASELRVGVMGLGVLGRDAAEVLARIGFDVAGWSNTPKAIPGIACFAGAAGLGPFLARTDVLVCLLPLTPGTRGILGRRTFEGLARDGKLGGPVVIKCGPRRTAERSRPPGGAR